ncbi:MAG: Kdo hydroxylase family protein [Sphingomonas sp.]|nr:Kdo hydroxylase family protein [Sphingomonas sp.]
MPKLFVNPNLPDYFLSVPEVTSVASARSYVEEYESAKVVVFPGLAKGIDHEFWAALDTDRYPELKKFSPILQPGVEPNEERHQLEKALAVRAVDKLTANALVEQFQRLMAHLIPAYRAIFADYAFDRWKIMLRLNTIMAENMHVDTYKKENEQHFARMFVNLDTQPRIWHTSWRIGDMVERAIGTIPPEQLDGLSRGQVWSRLNANFFGQNSREWWDEQPRHIAFFAPGDVWIVDSRQVAHQIFYGRRALSIDFSVPKQLMKDPSLHYLEIAERFRADNSAAHDATRELA